MAGTKNDVLVGKNADFTQVAAPNATTSEANGLFTNGQLWIGSTAVNAGGTHINVGAITSPSGTVAIGYSTPNITLAAGPTVATTYNENSGSATPAASILNVLGNNTAQNGFATWTTGSGNTINSISNGTAKWVVNPTAGVGTHTTIQSAINTAASGDTIFITAKSTAYTENLTLKAGVNLTAFVCDRSGIGNVTISGTCTMTTAGTAVISGINLQTNSAPFLAVTGSAASIVILNNCKLSMTNNTGITFSSSDSGSAITINDCTGNIGTTGISLFTMTSTGTMQIQNCDIENSGSSTTASTISSGILLVKWSQLVFPITTTSTSVIQFVSSQLVTTTNTTPLTHGGSSSNCVALGCQFNGGSSPAISISTAMVVQECVISSSNTNAITGAGTISYSGISFNSSSTTINTTTQTNCGTLQGSKNTAPSAGFLGEQITSYVPTGSAVSLVSTTSKNVTSISLTAGIWDVSCMCGYTLATTTIPTYFQCSISIVSNTSVGAFGQTDDLLVASTSASLGTGYQPILKVPCYRVTSSSTATWYLVATSIFSVSTCSAYGRITATRVG